jgi:hypothetical protein
MTTSEDLKNLIDASLADGKISSKERNILLKRAVNEGLDKDEFELYLDSLVFTKTPTTEGIFNKVIYHRKSGVKKIEVERGLVDLLSGGKKEFQEIPVNQLTIKLWHVLVPLVTILIVLFSIFMIPKSENVDDALSRYDFEIAREIAADMDCRNYGNSWDGDLVCPKSIALIKIIINEANYMAENNEFEKAFSVIEEINGIEFYTALFEKGDIGKSQDNQKDELYLNVISKGILKDRLTNKEVNVYLTKVKSKSVKKEIKGLLN